MSIDPAQHPHAAAAPRRGSGALARLLTALYALVALPTALGLLAYGGTVLRRLLLTQGPGDGSVVEVLTAAPGLSAVGALGAGALLLVSVVVSGLFSSAGLLMCGVLGLGPLLLTALPPVLIQLVMLRPNAVPMVVLEGIIYGAPLVLPVLLGGLGAAMMLARRRPEHRPVAMLLGLILIPLGLLAAVLLLFRAQAGGLYEAITMFTAQVDPVVALLAVLGAVLLWLSAAATRWSPYALVLPAIVLLLATAVLRMPDLLPLPSILWTSRAGQVVTMFLDSGGGAVAAAILLAHTVVLPVVRARSRRRSLRSAPAPAPTAQAPAEPTTPSSEPTSRPPQPTTPSPGPASPSGRG